MLPAVLSDADLVSCMQLLCCSLHVLFVAAAFAVPSSVACSAATHIDATTAVTFAAVLYFCRCCCCIQSTVCGCCLPLHMISLAAASIRFSLVVLPRTSTETLQSPQDTFSNIRESALLTVGVFSRQSYQCAAPPQNSCERRNFARGNDCRSPGCTREVRALLGYQIAGRRLAISRLF